MHKKIVALLFGLALFGGILVQPAYATNWFQVQTEALPEWGKGTLIGFLEPNYTETKYTPASNGQIPKADYTAPLFNNTTDLMMQRARLFIRGSINPDISYYVGTEAGQNGYTYSFGNYAPRIIDANVLFSHYIPGVRVELGIIRAPGPEGAMEGFMSFNYLETFPPVIAQLMQPSFYTKNVNYAQIGKTGGYSVPGADISGNNGFRYPGVQAEDWFMIRPNVELAYGLMLGDNGRQFESGTSNGPIGAGRLQMSYLLDNGKGRFFRNDITGFVWYQQSHPELNGTSNTMIRDGFGMTYRDGYMQTGAKSFKAEFINGTGDIAAPAAFNIGLPQVTDTTYYPGSNNQAYGYDASAGYFVSNKIEMTLRYDYYDRLPNLAAQERIFKDIGAGVQYHITPLTRVVFDYFFRQVQIPNPSAVGNAAAQSAAESVVNGIGNQFNIYAVFAF
ncbi:MAG TPA: hypothetical protein VFN66_00225 [Burkholderiales bacterium]|nr:hypothetical protein [Burkholderiales bacterium]